jgi:hypothetical protein
MTKWRPVALAILIAGAAVLYLQVAHRKQGLQAPANTEAASSVQDGSVKDPTRGPGSTSALPGTIEEPILSGPTASSQPINPPPPSPASPVADTPESSTLPPATILENMRTTIHQYGSEFGENPVGTNPEITAVLQGDNPKHINFLKQDGNRVNSNGELVDAWGTPYFFHQISGHEMEIRSAGPDRVMYTGDDLMIK